VSCEREKGENGGEEVEGGDIGDREVEGRYFEEIKGSRWI
jgi:hypothetical protein